MNILFFFFIVLAPFPENRMVLWSSEYRPLATYQKIVSSNPKQANHQKLCHPSYKLKCIHVFNQGRSNVAEEERWAMSFIDFQVSSYEKVGEK